MGCRRHHTTNPAPRSERTAAAAVDAAQPVAEACQPLPTEKRAERISTRHFSDSSLFHHLINGHDHSQHALLTFGKKYLGWILNFAIIHKIYKTARKHDP